MRRSKEGNIVLASGKYFPQAIGEIIVKGTEFTVMALNRTRAVHDACGPDQGSTWVADREYTVVGKSYGSLYDYAGMELEPRN